MSHSQFHSTDLFILRHAWLNLWDKHMTTGRINQVSYSEWGTRRLIHSAPLTNNVFFSKQLTHSREWMLPCCPFRNSFPSEQTE